MSKLKDIILNNLWFKILASIAILLIVIGFFLPPQGEIHPSVLYAGGEIFAFAALGVIIKALDQGKTASIKHKDTTVIVGSSEELREALK